MRDTHDHVRCPYLQNQNGAQIGTRGPKKNLSDIPNEQKMVNFAKAAKVTNSAQREAGKAAMLLITRRPKTHRSRHGITGSATCTTSCRRQTRILIAFTGNGGRNSLCAAANCCAAAFDRSNGKRSAISKSLSSIIAAAVAICAECDERPVSANLQVIRAARNLGFAAAGTSAPFFRPRQSPAAKSHYHRHLPSSRTKPRPT